MVLFATAVIQIGLRKLRTTFNVIYKKRDSIVVSSMPIIEPLKTLHHI
jgi:hypothetical protein